MSLLRNKVIAVTGSSSGIGRAIATRCAQQGAAVVLHHLGTSETKSEAQSLRDSLGQATLDGSRTSHLAIGTDLTADGAADSLMSQTISYFGRIDGLVNNAGICQFAPATSVTKPLLQRHLDVNFTAAYLLTQAATHQMVRQGTGGSVVSISSITATMGSSNLTHYAPTKAALLAMSKSMAVEFGAHGIRYNCVLPGTIMTSMNAADLEANGKRAWMEARVPLGRLGQPDDIAGVVVFLASDLAKYVTGEQILVDGGAAINYQ
ncbi:SDR family NAD(P)-dependent oxidoreductase [Aspergillus lucknowensis]|uniref:Uncharacterized protein n=1 Tax=Aspergillus lucknowensis TaxID=176173 RepID=A0ABR4LIR9_9EURO